MGRSGGGDRSLIHLDHNATSPLRPCAREALEHWLSEDGWGNASSVHASGRKAQERIEQARDNVARLLGTRSGRITFVSGATEANNAAVTAWAARDRARPMLVASRLEHPSVQEPMLRLAAAQGVEWLPVTPHGRVDLAALEALPSERVGMLAVMAANNETGALQPWAEACAWGQERSVPVHVDLTQVVGKVSLSLDRSGAASASLSGHKLGALAGIGVLWSREDLAPVSVGGSQERGRRAGTENLAGIVTLGAVAEWIVRQGDEERARLERLGKALRELLAAVPGIAFGVPQEGALAGTVHLLLPADSEPVLIRLDMQGVCASMGSACSAGVAKPSRTLLAMGWTEGESRRALRLSLGWSSTEDEVREAVRILGQILSNFASAGKSSV